MGSPRFVRFLTGAAASASVILACYAGEAPSNGTAGRIAASGCTPDIASIQSTVFVRSCTSSDCHDASKPASGLDLASPGVDGRLVGAPSSCAGHLLVDPGSPSTSELIDKVANAKPTCGGDRMPQGGVLAADDVACLTDWIASLKPGATADGGTIDAGPTVSCGSGQTACGSTCANTTNDRQNCGACGKACSEPFCVDGACSSQCTKTACPDRSCVDLSSDVNNCGGCGTKCAGGKLCVASACSCGSTSVTLAQLQSSIFSPSCTGGGCHSQVGPKAPAEGLDLSNATNAYATLVGKPSTTCSGRTRVVAGDVSQSYLINKITGVDICSGSKMPKGAGLTAAQIDSVRAWICSGAPK